MYSAIFNFLSTRRYYITCQSFFYTLICQNCKFSCGLSCPALPCGLLHSLSRRFPPLQLCTQLFQRFFLNARYIAPRLLQAARRQPPPPASLAIMAGSPPFRQAPKMRGPDQLLPSGPPPLRCPWPFPALLSMMRLPHTGANSTRGGGNPSAPSGRPPSCAHTLDMLRQDCYNHTYIY